MTFADMMQMRRLGATEVSPDGKWLIYSVTDVDLAKNSKTDTLWIQEISGGSPRRLEGTEPGDSGVKFSHDGKKLLFLSSRNKTQQIFLADFDPGAGNVTRATSYVPCATNNVVCAANNVTCATSNVACATQNVTSATKNVPNSTDNVAGLGSLDADNALWTPDGKSIVFTAQVYPDCPAITPDHETGTGKAGTTEEGLRLIGGTAPACTTNSRFVVHSSHEDQRTSQTGRGIRRCP